MRTAPIISLEYFPPRDIASQERLVRSAKRLTALNPSYVSVTFGAGGSTRSGTSDTVRMLQNLGLDVAPHLSCIGATRSELLAILQDYKSIGVRRLVALRGDMPSGMGGNTGDLHYAVDLVRFIRESFGDAFHIEVAAYPEMHPQADGFETDMQYFIDKINAGADSAITQYFFNPDAYFNFVDQLLARGIDIPVIPGIMPITNYTQLARFSKMCGAEIPRWMKLRLQDYGDDKSSIREFGIEVISHLANRLIDQGAPGLHFYTLNNADIVARICDNLQANSRQSPALVS